MAKADGHMGHIIAVEVNGPRSSKGAASTSLGVGVAHVSIRDLMLSTGLEKLKGASAEYK